MKSIRRSLMAVMSGAIVLLLAGCNTVSLNSTAYLGTPNFPPTDPASVEVLQTAPTRPHMRLGEITAEPSGNPTKEEIEKKLQVAAAKMGPTRSWSCPIVPRSWVES